MRIESESTVTTNSDDSESEPVFDDGHENQETYSTEDFYNAVREHQPAGTKQIAEIVGCSRRTAHDRLGTLEKQGHISSKKIGRELAWFIELG
jgi:predicted transcriptional regulator